MPRRMVSHQKLYLLERLVGALLLHFGQERVDEVSAVLAALDVLLEVLLVLVDHPLQEALRLLLQLLHLLNEEDLIS